MVQLAENLELTGDHNGRARAINGNKSALKESQAYTKAFGKALHLAWETNLTEIRSMAITNNYEAENMHLDWSILLNPLRTEDDPWLDAELNGVFDLLLAAVPS